MIVVSFDEEMREAFAAGKASVLPLLWKGKKDAKDSAFLKAIPRTYEEWLESRRDRPKIMRG